MTRDCFFLCFFEVRILHMGRNPNNDILAFSVKKGICVQQQQGTWLCNAKDLTMTSHQSLDLQTKLCKAGTQDFLPWLLLHSATK
jgi:hypothetical protein